MKKIKTNIIPPKGFAAITLYPFVFVRKEWAQRTNIEKYWNVMQHEEIHGAQQKEMLLIGFYLWYLVEWLVKWAYYMDAVKAYKAISFEREAYANESDATYLYNRSHFAWLEYIKR